MTDLNQTIQQKASGETRFKPDEQRLYMGTFRERVIATISLDEVRNPALIAHFEDLLREITSAYQHVTLKISPKISVAEQMKWMKEAKQAGCEVSIIDEAISTSPYGLVFHTNTAIDRDEIDALQAYPELFQTVQDQQAEKKSFWKKLFSK